MTKPSYALYIDETSIKFLSSHAEEKRVKIHCMNTFLFDVNIYSEFLDKGESDITRKIMFTLIQELSKTETDLLTICFKMNNVKSHLAFFDAGMDEDELDRQCDLEASRFLISPANYTLYRERLSKKIIRTLHLHWIAYIPTKYFNRLGLLLLPIKQKNRSFSVSHRDLVQLLPKTNNVIMLLEIQERYIIISKVQSRKYFSIKYFNISHPTDAIYFASWELKNEMESFPIYMTGNGANIESAETIFMATKKKVHLLPMPENIDLDPKENFHSLAPAIGTMLKDLFPSQTDD